jgi:hypothetical protein
MMFRLLGRIVGKQDANVTAHCLGTFTCPSSERKNFSWNRFGERPSAQCGLVSVRPR